MKILISLSQTLDNYMFFKKQCFEIILKEQYNLVFSNKDIQIISGGVNREDFEERFCKEFKLENKIFVPEWKNMEDYPVYPKSNKFGTYNGLAGMNRNTKMVEYISTFENKICLGFDRETNEVKDVLRKSKKAGIKTYQIKCKDLENYKIKIWNK